jgi:hypothetical protein
MNKPTAFVGLFLFNQYAFRVSREDTYALFKEDDCYLPGAIFDLALQGEMNRQHAHVCHSSWY